MVDKQFASTKRDTALSNMKTAMRYKDQAAINNHLRDAASLTAHRRG
ncbi:MAG: hypothetical protein IJ859_00275 [Synergistaceae bacterium]|nr:hypothetical protein [Synergistaceae bacterium]